VPLARSPRLSADAGGLRACALNGPALRRAGDMTGVGSDCRASAWPLAVGRAVPLRRPSLCAGTSRASSEATRRAPCRVRVR